MTQARAAGQEPNVANEAILTCHQLVKIYQDGERCVEVLKGVMLEVVAGEMVAIIGASGSGKSTLLHLLGGLDTPTSGQVLLGGQDIHALSESRRAALRNQSLGFIYQFHHLLPEFTVLENVMLPLLIGGENRGLAHETALTWLQQVGLKNLQNRRIAALSGGERQRIAIARALVTHPQCVLADEPTGNLDPETAEQTFQLMRQLCQTFHTSFIIVTHNLTLARKMDRILLLNKGQLQSFSEVTQ